ncbi:MAG: hypothetical protein IT195_09695 [Microthrixaceae bacterium]|nr:hypothetical protein [Microthrixaceae bacterium]
MTVRFLADENFNRKIVVGLQRRIDDLDLVRVQEVGLRAAEQPMAGVIVVPTLMALATAIEDLELVVGASLDDEWDNQVSYLPLR